jgi:hemoglobin
VSDTGVTLYERLGGEAGVRALVDRFYDEMDTAETAAAIRAMHPPDLAHAREMLFWFLSGWLGGPPLYMQNKGHPRLRARHLPFAIDSAARDAWMHCMRVSLQSAGLPADIHSKLEAALWQLADHMRNRDDAGA